MPQILAETNPSAHSFFKKLNFGNSNQKSRKNLYQTFLFLPNITGILYFNPNILSEIVVRKKVCKKNVTIKQL